MTECRVVAEAGQCSGSDIGLAIRMAAWAAQAGAFGFKVQLLHPETIARADAKKYWADELGTNSQREAFTKAGLVDYARWAEVKAACDDYGIEFLATPFDLAAVEALANMGVRYMKIASGDITYRQLLEAVRETGCQVILSTGACYWHEISRALRWLRGAEVTLLACTLSYPTFAAQAHLARIHTLRSEYPGIPVGYSDHTSLPETALGAAVLGSVLNEVHYTYDNDGPNVPDHKIAVDPERLKDYVAASTLGAVMRGNGSLIPDNAETAARLGARRSICAARDLPAGHVLTTDDLVFLRPGDGIPPYLESSMVGTKLHTPVRAGAPLSA